MALGNFGLGGWIGLILDLIVWIGLLAGLTLLAIRAIRGAKAPAVTGPSTSGPLTAKQLVQARYARGEITRDEYGHGDENLK
jgi:putative membrane protein